MVLLLAEVVPVPPPPLLAVAFDDVPVPIIVPELEVAVAAGVEKAVCATERDRMEHKAKKRRIKVLILAEGRLYNNPGEIFTIKKNKGVGEG